MPGTPLVVDHRKPYTLLMASVTISSSSSQPASSSSIFQPSGVLVTVTCGSGSSRIAMSLWGEHRTPVLLACSLPSVCTTGFAPLLVLGLEKRASRFLYGGQYCIQVERFE
jgi:hypothetical protein